MCTYCMIADWANNHWPLRRRADDPFSDPFIPLKRSPLPGVPLVPTPSVPDWSREQLEQFEEILRRVKEMEDKLGGCPCEDPKKMEFLDVIRKRLDALEKRMPE